LLLTELDEEMMLQDKNEQALLEWYRAMSDQAKGALLGAAEMYAENFPSQDDSDGDKKAGEVSLALLALNDSLLNNYVVQ
jgi:hypothetical protein